MPDTSPLSRGRKLVALVVLLGLFAASMGVAVLVENYTGRVETAARVSVTFKLDPALGLKADNETSDPDALTDLASDDGHRTAVVYKFEQPEQMSSQLLAATAARAFLDETRREPVTIEGVRWQGYSAVELQSTRTKRGFAILRMAWAGDNIVGVLYRGDTAFAPNDQKTFEALMNCFAFTKGGTK
jgi:hypothetical protein